MWEFKDHIKQDPEYTKICDPTSGEERPITWAEIAERKEEQTKVLLREASVAVKETARLCRFWTGHFPHGEFHLRFNLDRKIECWCGALVETREHILLECPL